VGRSGASNHRASNSRMYTATLRVFEPSANMAPASRDPIGRRSSRRAAGMGTGLGLDRLSCHSVQVPSMLIAVAIFSRIWNVPRSTAEWEPT
jgi:hypothetical protein